MALASELPTPGVLAPEERSVVSGSGELLLAAKIGAAWGSLASMLVDVGWICSFKIQIEVDNLLTVCDLVFQCNLNFELFL